MTNKKEIYEMIRDVAIELIKIEESQEIQLPFDAEKTDEEKVNQIISDIKEKHTARKEAELENLIEGIRDENNKKKQKRNS